MGWNKETLSIVVQSIITIIIILVICYLSICQREIPELLNSATLLILGYWFGSLGTTAIQAVVRQANSRSRENRNKPS